MENDSKKSYIIWIIKKEHEYITNKIENNNLKIITIIMGSKGKWVC